MKKEKIANVLIYTLFLVNIALVLWVVVLNMSNKVFNVMDYQSINKKLISHIEYKGGLAIKYLKKLNENGGGYQDNISCPNSVSMSWSISSGTINTDLFYNNISEFPYCSGAYMWTGLILYFTEDFWDFTGALYKGTWVGLVGRVWQTPFWDSDNTEISFDTRGLAWVDNIDDDFNNDDYKVLGGSWTYYPDDYQDDDVIPRKVIYGYVDSWVWYQNIFWLNTKVGDIIAENTNNDDTLNKKIGETSTGYLFLDINKEYAIKMTLFDRYAYEDFWELRPIEVLDGTGAASIGYLQYDGTLSGSLTNAYKFDFQSNDYALFLKNFWTWALFFTLKWYTDDGTEIYINSLDDSDDNVVRYFGNDILISEDKRYLSEELELFYEK